MTITKTLVNLEPFMTTLIGTTKPVALRFLAPLAAVTTALTLSACGGGSDAPTTTAQNTAVTNGAACTKLSPKVGQIATLSTKAHGVSGKARIVDDCTIEITNFNYDGGGLPDVFVYGAKAKNYAAGFAIGTNLFGKSQTNATLVLTLKDKEIDNLDGISIWCVRAGANFGDGTFVAP
jgi:Electron transfer DM13